MKNRLNKMKRALRNAVLFGLVGMLTLGTIFPKPEALTAFAAEPVITTDTPVIYDIADLTGKNEVTYADTGLTIATLPSNSNVGIRFKVNTTFSKMLGGFRFLDSDEDGWGKNEYQLRFDWGADLYVPENGVATSKVDDGPEYAGNQDHVVEISFANYYEDGVRTGTLISYSVDGTAIGTYVDKNPGYDTMGKTFGWSEEQLAYMNGTNGTATLKTCKVAADPVITTDTPVIYDIADLTGENEVTYADTGMTIATLPSNSNVGIRFKVNTTFSKMLGGFRFLDSDEDGWGKNEYQLRFDWGADLYVPENGVATSKVDDGPEYTGNKDYVVEISFANYYEDGVRTGTLISYSIDGTEIGTYVDKNPGYDAMGTTFGWSEEQLAYMNGTDGTATLKTCKVVADPVITTDTPVIYDIADLTGTESVTYTDSAKIAELPTNENVGVKFKLDIKQSDVLDHGRVPIGFLSADEGGWGGDDYLFKFEWDTELYVRGNWTDGSGKVTNGGSAFSNSGTYEVLVTFVNYYEDGVRKGTKVICSVDGTEVVSYVDKSAGYATMGKYITWDENYQDQYKNGKVTLKSCYTPVETVIRLIANLPAVNEITDADGEVIMNARDKYNALTTEEKALVTNYSVLEAAEARYQELHIERTFDEATVYDLYDLTGNVVVDCVASSPTYIGHFPEGKNNNVALRFKLNVEQPGSDHARFAIGFMADENDNGYGTSGYTMFADWGWKLFTRKNIGEEGVTADAVSTWDGSDAINKSNPAFEKEVELGCVKYYENGVWKGNKIYVQVDGIEMVSYIDTAKGFDKMGTGITWNRASRDWGDLEGKVSLSDVRAARFTVAEIPNGLSIKNKIIVMLGKEDIHIPTQIGICIDKVTLDGTDITSNLEKVSGGYLLKMDGITSGGTLVFETSEKNCVLSVKQTPDAVIDAPKNVPFGGTATIKIIPELGKSVTSVLIGGREMLDSFKMKKGVLSFELQDVVADTSITVTCEDKNYAIHLETVGKGTATVDRTSVPAGGSVKLNITPKNGWYILLVTYNDKPLLKNANGEWVIEHVTADLNVKVTFENKANLSTSTSPKTGDSSNVFAWWLVAAAAFVTFVSVVTVNRNRRKK